VRALFHVIVKEFLQLRRDRKMIPATILGPIVQLLALGYAANTDVTEVPMVLVDQDRTAASRALVDRFEGSGHFRVVGSEPSVTGLDSWLLGGRAQIALVIGAGYAKALQSGTRAGVQIIADGTDSNSAVVGLGYASRILASAGAGSGGVTLAPRVWYNPDLKSRWFFVPAILAMTLMLTTMILPSMAVVREKEIGTLEQISVTPVRPWQLVLGKLFPFAVIGIVDLGLVSALVRGLFRVPMEGSFFLLVGLTLLFLMTTLGLGLFVSTLVRTQQQAMMTAAFVFMVPMIYLSGLIFPIENMPGPVQIFTYAIPLRYYNNVVRGILLKGSGFGVLWPEAVVLACFGGVVLALASLRFRKSLD
jgi:ABC-2 type transport system permease protein